MNRQVCQLCALDDDIVTFIDEDDPEQVVLMCEGPNCAQHTWRPRKQISARGGHIARSGIGEELGVYDDLVACVANSETWLEYGIVEHRYKEAHPATYARMVRRWGHRAKAPTKYSMSSFLGGCLGHLAREGVISTRRAPTSAYWSYLSAATHAAGVPRPPEDRQLSWATYAETSNLDPDTWTL
jgi:hypothetical protein